MPDSLDPVDAIMEGATDGVKRLLAFALVTAGAAMLGLNLHEIPTHIANIQANGVVAVLDVLKQFNPGSPFLWVLMMMHSAAIWYLLPFLAVYIFLLFRLWGGSEMFNILFALTVIHPVHTFLYMQRQSPLVPGDLLVASGVLVASEISIVGLVLWWRYVKENAPPPPAETEPEL
jgi:hypothetical protein